MCDGRSAHHVPGGLSLGHALGCQARTVAAALDAAFRVPCALTVADQDYPSTRLNGRQRQRRQILSILK
jgi:hypothetical protein